MNLLPHLLSHLVPIGTPIPLSFFIALIEFISLIIRPITLCVRLSANIIAGHLLICLLRNIRENFFLLFLPTLPVLYVLLVLELCVRVIQGYVFVVLLSLYIDEV
ncbi:hypothetical protein FCN23_09585 [Campylobacter jejuni]|nr:hypothetical protein FCN23_09585 [Campylobacter jejuni]